MKLLELKCGDFIKTKAGKIILKNIGLFCEKQEA